MLRSSGSRSGTALLGLLLVTPTITWAVGTLLSRQPGIAAWRLHRSLVNAVGIDAPFAARLVGFRYPPHGGSLPVSRPIAERIARAVDRMGDGPRRHLRGSDTPRARHLNGLVQLLGDWHPGDDGEGLDRAIASLRSAVDQDPSQAALHSDLSAALWLRVACLCCASSTPLAAQAPVVTFTGEGERLASAAVAASGAAWNIDLTMQADNADPGLP